MALPGFRASGRRPVDRFRVADRSSSGRRPAEDGQHHPCVSSFGCLPKTKTRSVELQFAVAQEKTSITCTRHQKHTGGLGLRVAEEGRSSLGRYRASGL